MRYAIGVTSAFGLYLAWLVQLPALGADGLRSPSAGEIMLTASLMVIAFVVAVGLAKFR